MSESEARERYAKELSNMAECLHSGHRFYSACVDCASSVLARYRDSVLEEAAKVAERFRLSGGAGGAASINAASRAIRALKVIR